MMPVVPSEPADAGVPSSALSSARSCVQFDAVGDVIGVTSQLLLRDSARPMVKFRPALVKTPAADVIAADVYGPFHFAASTVVYVAGTAAPSCESGPLFVTI